MAKRQIIHGLTLLGSITSTTLSGFAQGAIVVVKDTYSGVKVYLGASTCHTEAEIEKDIAGSGDELPFDVIEQIYFAMKASKEELVNE